MAEINGQKVHFDYILHCLFLAIFSLPQIVNADDVVSNENDLKELELVSLDNGSLDKPPDLGLSDVLDNSLKENENYQVKFGGWSDHYISGKASNYDFNESHEGIGIAYSSYQGNTDETEFFNGYNYEIWYMKDSFYEDNLQISYGLFHRKLIDRWGISNLDIGLNFALISRSSADIDTKTAELNDHKRIHTPMVIPSLSLYTNYKVHFDFVFLPAIPNVTDYSVIFFRAGINL